MIVARAQGKWALLNVIKVKDGQELCGLATGKQMPELADLMTQVVPSNGGLWGYLPRDPSMEFLPDMYWRGIPVEIWGGWDAEADEPTLLLLVKQNSGEVLTPEVQRQRKQLLDDHGWEYSGTVTALYRKCRLDDPSLELVPGEPPRSLYR